MKMTKRLEERQVGGGRERVQQKRQGKKNRYRGKKGKTRKNKVNQ